MAHLWKVDLRSPGNWTANLMAHWMEVTKVIERWHLVWLEVLTDSLRGLMW